MRITFYMPSKQQTRKVGHTSKTDGALLFNIGMLVNSTPELLFPCKQQRLADDFQA